MSGPTTHHGRRRLSTTSPCPLQTRSRMAITRLCRSSTEPSRTGAWLESTICFLVCVFSKCRAQASINSEGYGVACADPLYLSVLVPCRCYAQEVCKLPEQALRGNDRGCCTSVNGFCAASMMTLQNMKACGEALRIKYSTRTSTKLVLGHGDQSDYAVKC